MSLLVSEDLPREGTDFADLPTRAGGAYSYPLYDTTQLSYPYTGDYRIDTLLQGAAGQSGPGALVFRWNKDFALGTPTAFTYSFASAAPVYGGNVDPSTGDTGFLPFNEAQKNAVRQIMFKLSQELGLNPVEVAPDTAGNYGQVRFGNNYQQWSSGYSWLPYSTPDDRSGDVWLDALTEKANLTDLAPGGVGYETLIHEIGHALGLKHPGNYNAGSASSTEPGNYLAAAEDNSYYTAMTYDLYDLNLPPRDWFGMYDLLALKTLYGARNYNAGDTVYSYDDLSGRVLKIIDDGSGFDTIDIAGVSSAGNRVVDMRPGTFSSIGVKANGLKAVQNVSIDFSTIVEKFVGTSYDDVVRGNDANNTFMLGLGSNVADGGAGLDFAQYAGNRASYQASGTGSGIRVTGLGVNDTLTNVERLTFADGKLAFDLDGNAGAMAKLLGVLVGDVARADLVGAGLGALDAGASYVDLMNAALNARLGPVRSNAEVVDLIFKNVVNVSPSAEQAAPYVNLLDSGSQTQASLAILAAETSFNTDHIGLVGLAQSGLTYA